MTAIRRAKEDDALSIAQVYIETWRSSYAGILPDHVLINMNPQKSMITFARTINHSSEIILVAEESNLGIVGMGSVGKNRTKDNKYLGEVFTLYVHPDHQNNGIGKNLLSELFSELTRNNINSAVIWVLANNPSRFFYEAVGGKLISVKDVELWDVMLKEYSYGWNNLKTTLNGQLSRSKQSSGNC